MSKIYFEQYWRIYTSFPDIFLLLLSADPADLSHIQKKLFSWKNPMFLDRKCALEEPELVQQQNYSSPKSA